MSDETPLPADLLQQLDSIEREANGMTVRALVEEVYDFPPIPRATAPNTPALHALHTELRGATREATRVRDVSLWVIVVGLGLCAVGIAGLRLDYVWIGLGALIASGFLIGFSAVALYKANERAQEASRELERFARANGR